MVKITEKTERELSTPDEILNYLTERYDGMMSSAKFRQGDSVDITNRSSMLPDVGIGNVGVVVGEVPDTPFTHVLMMTASGSYAVMHVTTESLTKRELQS